MFLNTLQVLTYYSFSRLMYGMMALDIGLELILKLKLTQFFHKFIDSSDKIY